MTLLLTTPPVLLPGEESVVQSSSIFKYAVSAVVEDLQDIRGQSGHSRSSD